MPAITSKAEYAQYEADVAEFVAREGISFLSTSCNEPDWMEGDSEGEPWFSWSPCECCGCSLGGNREYLYAKAPEGTVGPDGIAQYIICEDCVYYVNYGRLDDATMERIAA